MLQQRTSVISRSWLDQRRAMGCRPAYAPRRNAVRHPGLRASSEDSRPIMMPDGAWYMISHDFQQPVYGNGFVIPKGERASVAGSPGLVVYKHGGQLAVRPMSDPGEIVTLEWQEVALAAVAEPAEMKLVPFGTTIETPSSVTIAPQDGSMMGVVLSAAVRPRPEPTLPMGDQTVYETFNTFSPRRTRKIQFKCLICGAINIKPINPHAWTEGSVFAKCGKCDITHKLKDNLKLFHELAGPVFNYVDKEQFRDIELPERFRLKNEDELN